MQITQFWLSLTPVQRALVLGIADMRYNRNCLTTVGEERLHNLEQASDGNLGNAPANLVAHLTRFIETKGEKVGLADVVSFLANQ